MGFYILLRRMEAFAHVEEHNHNSQLLSLAGIQVLLLQNGPLQFLLEFLLVWLLISLNHLKKFSSLLRYNSHPSILALCSCTSGSNCGVLGSKPTKVNCDHYTLDPKP
jgi:hypothetical protein